MALGRVFVCWAFALWAQVALGAVRDGTTEPGVDLRYVYTPTTAGDGALAANWDPHPQAVSYLFAIGTAPFTDDVFAELDIGDVTSYSATGLSVELAQTATVYFTTVTPVASGGPLTPRASNGVAIAEGVLFRGLPADFGTVVQQTATGGYTLDFPAGSGFNVVFGEHYFEEVNIAAGTTVYVQPFGKEDAVQSGGVIPPEPADGWLRLFANTVVIDGVIEARGRGYGGGAGGGADPNTPATGGGDGLSGNGGSSTFLGGVGSGAAGGGSNSTTSGAPGQPTGGGGGGVSEDGYGPNGLADDYTGGAGVPDNTGQLGGGGGGGYGAGGGGGGREHGAGGGGGGTGGEPGGLNAMDNVAPGGNGAGPGGGPGGAFNGEGGHAGGYDAPGQNLDATTDRTLLIGSGGGGGANHNYEAAGGGAAGGAAVYLQAGHSLTVSGEILASGGGGGGGGLCDDCDTYAGAGGGGGAGGGILLEGPSVDVNDATIRTLGGQTGTSTDGSFGATGGDGDANTENGGTVKVFAQSQTGSVAANQAGRVYEASLGWAPVADAGGPYQTTVDIDITLDGSGSYDDNLAIVSWEWDFDGDGGFNNAAGEHPVFPATTLGSHTVALRVTNTAGVEDVITVDVDVLNESPIGQADQYTVEEDRVLVVEAELGVLSNDDDTLGALSAFVDAPPADGILELNTDGSFTYTPNPDFFGEDSFVYLADGGDVTSLPTTVSITVTAVNDPPEFVDPTPSGTLAVVSNRELAFTLVANDVDNADLTFGIQNQPEGSVLDSASGLFTWTPRAADIGVVTVGLVVSDGSNTTARSLVIMIERCAEDVDCSYGTCSAGLCVGDGQLAEPCFDGGVCQSGFCADGVCCDQACDGELLSCNRPEAEGTCTDLREPLGSPSKGCTAAVPAGGLWLLLLIIGYWRLRR